jgi:hypothetical protein
VKEGTQSNPSFAYHRRERGRKLHVAGHNSRFLPRSAGQSEELGDDADLWFVYENWRSPEGFDAPMLSEHLKACLKATPDLVAGNAPHRNATNNAGIQTSASLAIQTG